jgi:hypothetical protein
MTEIDIETRIELLLINYAAMIATITKLQRDLDEAERRVKAWKV